MAIKTERLKVRFPVVPMMNVNDDKGNIQKIWWYLTQLKDAYVTDTDEVLTTAQIQQVTPAAGGAALKGYGYDDSAGTFDPGVTGNVFDVMTVSTTVSNATPAAIYSSFNIHVYTTGGATAPPKVNFYIYRGTSHTTGTLLSTYSWQEQPTPGSGVDQDYILTFSTVDTTPTDSCSYTIAMDMFKYATTVLFNNTLIVTTVLQ